MYPVTTLLASSFQTFAGARPRPPTFLACSGDCINAVTTIAELSPWRHTEARLPSDIVWIAATPGSQVVHEVLKDISGSATVFIYRLGRERGAVASLDILKCAAHGPAESTQPALDGTIVLCAKDQWLAEFASGNPVLTSPWAAAAASGAALSYCLPPPLRAIATAAADCDLSGRLGGMYRDAKFQELLCETLRLWFGGTLTPMCPDFACSAADYRRLNLAKWLIENHYRERLTVADIGRRCGLNRAKLTKGFRELFKHTVSQSLMQHRLVFAARCLRSTERTIAVIGYEAGYNNISSFTRAFSRYFGISPSMFRNLVDADVKVLRVAGLPFE